MLTMDKINDIRNRYFHKGENLSEIVKSTGLDWKTVRKYVDKEDFNEPVKRIKENRLCPKLDPFKKVIDSWLEGDRKAPRKQRHCAKKVYKELKKQYPETFNCSYKTVANYFKVRKKELLKTPETSAMPLVHKAGEAQVDFGSATYFENCRRIDGKYLEVTFPFSNKGYLQLFPGENMECLLEGLVAIFKHINFVPRVIWFDNTKTIVTNILKNGQRDLTDRFKRFREHYKFHSVFTNPGKGNEKGCVENKVGYHRRNILVPVPEFENLLEYNKYLLEECDKDSVREHYRKNAMIDELFEEDFKNGLAIPGIEFETSQIIDVSTDSWGKFYLNKTMHSYSSSPKYSNSKIAVKLTSQHVIVLDENYRVIISHRRLYGDYRQESMEWLPYLKQLSFRPRALKYTGIYDMMPDVMRNYVDSCSNTETGRVLKVLSELTDRNGFENALKTVEQAVKYQATNADSLKNLHRRLFSDLPELPPMKLPEHIKPLSSMNARLDEYDNLLRDRGEFNA